VLETGRHGVMVAAAGVLLTGTLGACETLERCGWKGCRSDVALAAAVESNLSQYPELGPPNTIRVRAYDGIVYLYGDVSTELQRSQAETVAALSGAQVRDSLSIDYGGR